MTNPTSIDFSPLTQARIPMAHFAKLCGASRVSVYKWLGGAQPRGLYRQAVDSRLGLIRRALERGTLPLPPTTRSDKFKALLKALKA
jgi:hypothetical protein